MSCVAEIAAISARIEIAKIGNVGVPAKNKIPSASASVVPASENCVAKIQFRFLPPPSTSGAQSAFSVHGKYAHAPIAMISEFSSFKSFRKTGAIWSTNEFGNP